MKSRIRTSAAPWAGAILVAALLPLLGPASPAQAATCSSEVPEPLPPSACDDATPPDTSLEPMNPSPNSAGWTQANFASFTFAAVNTDPADTDAMRLECKLEGPTQAHDWATCQSPKTYTDLVDTVGDEAYTFTVRAYDSADRAITFDDPQTLPPPLGTADTEVSDEDATPESLSWRQDTVVPHAFIFGGPYDSTGSGWPVALKRSVKYTVAASENPVTYTCDLTGSNVPCDKGRVLLNRLTGGDHVFSVDVEDPAGNASPTTASLQFTVPFNLTRAKNWTSIKRKGTFSRDVLQTRTRGARIKFRASNIRELLLIAPSGKGYGRVRVRVGTGVWTTISLRSNKNRAQRTYVVRDNRSQLFSGQVQIEALSNKRLVQVDALAFPPG